MPDGTNSLLVHGLVRVGFEELTQGEPYWRPLVNSHDDETEQNRSNSKRWRTARGKPRSR
jgi:hypothetical protein